MHITLPCRERDESPSTVGCRPVTLSDTEAIILWPSEVAIAEVMYRMYYRQTGTFARDQTPAVEISDFTVRGVTNPEKLTVTVSGKDTGSVKVEGAMVFNRNDYGMNKGIPFIKIADHVDVSFHLLWRHVGGPPLA
jgi:hypothetical protein